MAFNAFESIANDFSSTRKKLKRYSSSPEGLRPAAPPAPPPAAPPTPVAPARTPVAAPVTPLSSGVAEALAALQQRRPMAAQPTKMPTDVAVALGALQQRGEQFGVDTTEFNYAAPDWGKVAAQMGEVNKVFDQMDSEIETPSFEGRQNGGLYGVIDRNLGGNYPHLFAESNPDASFWDRSIGRTTGAVGRGLRQTVGRPSLGVGRAIGEFAQNRVGSNAEAIANLERSEGEVISSIFADLGVVDPEQWNDLIKTDGQVKADLLLSRRWLAAMGSSSFETGTQATSEFTDERNLADNQYRIKRLLEIDPSTGKTRAAGQLEAGSNPAKLLAVPLALFEASEGVVTLGGRLALSQLGRQIDIANGGDGSKGEMWGDIIGSFVGSFPKNPAGAMRVGDSAGTIYRNADDVAAGLRATGRPVQQGSGIAAATGLDFAGSEVRDLGELAQTLAGPPLSGALRAGERYAEAVGRAGTGNALDPVRPRVSRGMASDGAMEDALEKAHQYLSDIMDRNIKAENSRDPDVRANAFGGHEARINAEVEAGEMIGKITRGEIELGTTPTTSSLTIEGGTPEINARLQSDIADTTANANAKKAQIDEIDRAFKDGELTPQEAMERYQAVNDPNILYPDPASPDPYRIQPKRPEALTAQQKRRRRIAEEDAEKAALEAGEFAEPDFAHEIGDTVSDASSLRFGEVVYIGDDVQPWKVDRVNGQLVDLDYIYADVDSGGFVGLRAEKSHDISKTPLIRSGFDYKNEVIPPRGTYKRESLDIAPSAPVAPVKAPRVTIRNVNKALADAGHNAKVHKGKDYIYFSGNDIDNWTETSVSVPRLTDDLGLDTPATVDNWVKEFERMKANPDINPVPTSGQATLDGGVVAARTEQDIVDARTVQSGFDLTATGEDAPLRQVDAPLSSAEYKANQNITSDADLAARAAKYAPNENGSPYTFDAETQRNQKARDIEYDLKTTPPDDIPGSHVGSGVTGQAVYDPEGKAFFMPRTADVQASILTSNEEDGWTYIARHDPSERGASYIEILDENGKRIDDVTNIISEGDARFMVIDGERKLIGLDGQPYDRSAPAPPPEAIVVSKSPTAPAIKLTRLQRTHLKVNGEMLPSTNVKGREAITELRKAVDETIADLKMRDERSGGRSDRVTGRIESFNDLDAKLKEIEAEAPAPIDPDHKRQGDERLSRFQELAAEAKATGMSLEEHGRKIMDIKNDYPDIQTPYELSRNPKVATTPEPPAAPVEPADPKYESQHGFNDDGTLTTFESQATEGIEQFDDKLAQSEMRLPKTQAELDAEQAAIKPYFDEDQYLHDFSDGSTVDNAPLFETRYADTPLGNAERKVDDLERELDGQAEYELSVRMEDIREKIDQSPLAPLMEVFDGRQAEEGLYPDQYYKIFGDGGVRLIPTGSKGNVIQRDYITWAQKAHPKDFKADRMVNKVFGADRRALSQKRNWTIRLEHTDQIPEQYRTTQTYAQNPDADNFEADVPTFLDDINSLRLQRDELLDYDANIKGIELEEAEDLKKAKRQELLAANDEVILQQGIVEPRRGSLNAEGAAREFSAASRIPQVGTQNPPDYSIGNNREIAERTINNLRGPYSPEEVAALSDNDLANLVAQNISRQNPRRGTMSTGGQGVNPNAVDPVVGRGDPVEQGLEYPVAGTNQATQSSQLEVERATRIHPSKGAPYKINSPEEADNALGAVYKPNPEIKVQVAAANLRGVIESGGYRVDAEDAFVNAMPGKDINLTKEMYKAVDEHKLDDIGSRTAFRLDPGRIANTGDQGQVIGPITNSVIETTQRTDDTGRIWQDTALRDWERLLAKYRIRKASVFKLKRNDDLERFTIIMERLSGDDVTRKTADGVEEIVPAEELLNKPAIKKAVQSLEYGDKIRFIQAAQDGRIFLDNLRNFQNKVRNKRGQKLIPWLPDYMPHIRRMTLWRKFGGLYEKSDMKSLDMLDFTAPPDTASLPGKAFNPHALARKWGLDDDVRELNADKLVRSYITTAMKDVFHTEIDRNIKANTKLWRKAATDDYSLDNIADAFDTYSAEAYLGVPSRSSKFIRDLWLVNRRLPAKYLVGGKIAGDRALPSAIDATIMLKTGLTRTVFPFNWTWNTFIQTSSGLLTPVRYGVRNSIQAIDAITSSSVKQDIDKFAYVARTKGRKGNSVVLQNTGDEVFAHSEDMPWQDRALEWSSFLSIQIEKHLTRHAIRAAYLRGQKLGYEGAELWQYASQGGARTQSMYNKADTVGALRSRELSSMIPFQTFAFEMFNTLAETNVPILRNFTGKLGAYESFSASTARGKATTYGRLKNLAIWLAGAVAINAIADRASNRKPWTISSFIPAWAMLSGGVNGLGPGSAILPVKFSYDVAQAIKAWMTHGDFRGLGSVGLRYFGLPGGTQIDKSWAGVEAVQAGVVRNKDRTTKFEVQAPEMKGITFDIPFIGETNITDAKINPEEFIKTYGQGIWSTNGGQEYLDEQLGRSIEGQSTFGKIKAGVAESFGLQKFPVDLGGKQGALNRDYEAYLDAYYKIPADAKEAEGRGLPSRGEFRRKNPTLDARLFVAGRFSTLQTEDAKTLAKELIIEHDLLNPGGGFFTGRGVDQAQEDIFRKELGDTWVNGIIGGKPQRAPLDNIREGYVPIGTTTTPAEPQASAPQTAGERYVSLRPVTTPAEPQSAAPQTANEQWRLVSTYLTRDNLVALQKIWDGKSVSRTESTSLKTVFEKVPLGQTNFRKWSKQTLRQLQENAVVSQRVRNPREAVTV